VCPVRLGSCSEALGHYRHPTLAKAKILKPSDLIATVGVSLLLLAYVLDVTDKLEDDSPWFFGLNAVGAGLACASAVMISFYPFVVLEGIWALVSIVAWARRVKNGPKSALRA
jgi:hypothetical protein